MSYISCYMKRILSIFVLVFIFLGGFLVHPELVKGQNDLLGTEYGAYSGLGNADPRSVVAGIIRAVMGLLGVGALIIFLYSGFEWMTAGGNDTKVNDAKKRMWYAIIGMGVILSAYAITMFVFRIVYESTTGRFFN